MIEPGQRGGGAAGQVALLPVITALAPVCESPTSNSWPCSRNEAQAASKSVRV